MYRLILRVALLIARAAPVTATPAEVKPGKYYRDRDTGTLQIDRRGRDGLTFEIESVGGNCHSCSISGRLRGASGLTDEGNGLTCKVSFKTVGTAIKVEPSAEGCRDFCGARAGFDGTYRALPKACTPEARQARRDQISLLYQASRYSAAVNALNNLMDQCKDHMNWIEIDQVRNDLALSQYHNGRPAECLATLKSTLADGFDGEEDLRVGNTVYLPPCDFDNYSPVAKAIWFNRTLCERAVQRSR